MRSLLLFFLRAYQRSLSPLLSGLGCSCRFYPSCSSYAEEAIRRLPPGRAMKAVVQRVLSCGPWHPGGIDFL